jgi:glucosamine-6-phosphate deaminase
MREFKKENLTVKIFETRALMGAAAADEVANKIADLLKKKKIVNIVFAAAPSQNEFLTELSKKDLDWKRVNAFHMDEYVGLKNDAPQLFGNFLKERIFGKVPLHNIFYMNGSATDLDEECKRYAELLERYPTDIVFLGIGENTHVAFNDPHVADFNDPVLVKIVDLDEKNRWQQVDPDDPSCFDHIEEVPTHAITLTVPALFESDYAYAIAPGEKKADAIYHTLTEEIQEKYPSTIFRKHRNAALFIDEKSAARL